MRNVINLETSKDYYCLEFKTVIHEMLHVIGLGHEQSRPDSEEYITVHYNQIKPEHHGLFKPDNGLVTYGLQYDYTSIMHYSEYGFAKDFSEVSIETKDPKFQKVIGTAAHPSDIDYQKVCAIYMCSECIDRPFSPPPETVNSTQATVKSK
ncbi:astacin (Peptidase family m12A) domain-containing protein [Ditylenchus destructor]|nr:astacin (Peptidase family m12A) domain-containing protein [Ditylenchus destructor]